MKKNIKKVNEDKKRKEQEAAKTFSSLVIFFYSNILETKHCFHDDLHLQIELAQLSSQQQEHLFCHLVCKQTANESM